MRIKRFAARNVHGYMNFNVKFNHDLTFLTGINGSGKTTVVNCLYAMLSPSFRMLSRIDYEYMHVYIRVPQQRRFVRISTTKNESIISLSTSETQQDLTIPVFLEDITESARRTSERENDYYEEAVNRNIDNAVLEYIRDLPSPMFLGIERRTIEPLVRRAPSYYYWRGHPGVNTPSNSQYQSLLEAEYLAREKYSAVQEKQRELTDNLRTDILLAALKYEDLLQLDWSQFAEIGPQRVDEINRMIRNVALELGLPRTEVEHALDVYISKLRSLVDTLGDALTDPDAMDKIMKGRDEQKRTACVEMVVNAPHFLRLNRIFEKVKEYIQQRQSINEQMDQYLRIVNSFLEDSNKEITFDGKGNLLVKVTKHEPVPITSLSSGESQILIMITHLSFNPDAQRANVFMVDEPELSLHVAWQELFVEAITKANPNLQIILATHAPSIILDRINKCIDLGR